MTRNTTLIVIDDDPTVLASMRALLTSTGYDVRAYSSAEAFLSDNLNDARCLITDVRMPGMSGVDLQQELARRGIDLPVLLVTAHGDVPLAVSAMKAGAVDFFEKPVNAVALLESIRWVLKRGQHTDRRADVSAARRQIDKLTPREKSVFDKIVQGKPNKIAGFELGISPRTIEAHRARIMQKLAVDSVADLVRLSIAAGDAPGVAQSEAE